MSTEDRTKSKTTDLATGQTTSDGAETGFCPDSIDRHLLDGWQRDFPLTSHPFAALGESLGLAEADVLSRLSTLSQEGIISRIGAVIRPNSAGVSTLAALAVPKGQVEEIAQLVNAQDGVNHNYLRENLWNLWFVATGPDKAHLTATLNRIRVDSGLPLMDLPMERAFHLDLGFSLLGGPKRSTPPPASPCAESKKPMLDSDDRLLLAAVAQGLSLVPCPYKTLARQLGWEEADVLQRVNSLSQQGVISRFGVVVRHRTLGWQSNAMVVWDLPDHLVEKAGQQLAAWPGVTLCYQRRRDPQHWPFNLYAMIHAKSRNNALQIVNSTESMAELNGHPRNILFSLRCFKQTGALLGRRRVTP